MNSEFPRGRWDRNRTCTLRLWSLLPFVQLRSGAYTRGLKIAHFDGPTCLEVHQRSPALGSTVGSNVANTACSLRANRWPGQAQAIGRSNGTCTPSREHVRVDTHHDSTTNTCPRMCGI